MPIRVTSACEMAENMTIDSVRLMLATPGFQVGEDGDLGVELGHGAGRGRGVDDVVFEFLQLVAGQVVEGVVVKGYVSGAAEQDVPTRPLLGQAMG